MILKRTACGELKQGNMNKMINYGTTLNDKTNTKTGGVTARNDRERLYYGAMMNKEKGPGGTTQNISKMTYSGATSTDDNRTREVSSITNREIKYGETNDRRRTGDARQLTIIRKSKRWCVAVE